MTSINQQENKVLGQPESTKNTSRIHKFETRCKDVPLASLAWHVEMVNPGNISESMGWFSWKRTTKHWKAAALNSGIVLQLAFHHSGTGIICKGEIFHVFNWECFLPVRTMPSCHFSAHLVGGWATPLKNISQLGVLFPIYIYIWNNKKNWNHQPDMRLSTLA